MRCTLNFDDTQSPGFFLDVLQTHGQAYERGAAPSAAQKAQRYNVKDDRWESALMQRLITLDAFDVDVWLADKPPASGGGRLRWKNLPAGAWRISGMSLTLDFESPARQDGYFAQFQRDIESTARRLFNATTRWAPR